jgi:hypothetical protein
VEQIKRYRKAKHNKKHSIELIKKPHCNGFTINSATASICLSCSAYYENEEKTKKEAAAGKVIV